MKIKIISGVIIAAVILTLAVLIVPDTADTVVNAAETAVSDDSGKAVEFVHGSAETPCGRTVIVSIFGDDPNYSWNFESETDLAAIDNINNYMGIAADFIEQTVADYGKSAEFITDFQENDDLFYSVLFDDDMTDWNYTDTDVWGFIDENIDTDSIMKKYDADNLIFFFILNTDENTEAVTCTRNWYEGMDYPYEVVYLYNIDSGLVNCPAVYAHEILHTFGAPDLYMEDEYFGIDGKALDYVAEKLPNEIMYTCSDIGTGEYLYDKVSNEVSGLTAYYIGLTDESKLVDELGLRESEHEEKAVG